MHNIFLGIGSNLGNREENLNKAIARIGELTGSPVISSSLYETEPWGFESEDRFLNNVVKINTNITPSNLMKEILVIEAGMGRVRTNHHFSSRVIDIDILIYNCRVIVTRNLVIPHPKMHERKFVLVPMCELDCEIYHPVLKRPMEYLLKTCGDMSSVELYKSRERGAGSF